MALVQDHPDAYAVCYTKAVDRLSKASYSNFDHQLTVLTIYQLVIEKQFPHEYFYYKVPTPWLQVKLLRLLQYYPPPGKGSRHFGSVVG